MATALMAQHEWVRAREELQAAITLQPDLALAHYNLGAVRYTLGDHAGAIEAYREVLRLTPDFADAHYNLGLVLKLTNQETDAAYEFLAAASAGLPKAQYFVGAAFAVAYNEFCSPTVDEAVEQMIATGVTTITVVPSMLTPGGSHSEIEIPASLERLRSKHPHIDLRYAWPFELTQVAAMLAAQLRRFHS